jgi:hypothetical protein
MGDVPAPDSQVVGNGCPDLPPTQFTGIRRFRLSSDVGSGGASPARNIIAMPSSAHCMPGSSPPQLMRRPQDGDQRRPGMSPD